MVKEPKIDSEINISIPTIDKKDQNIKENNIDINIPKVKEEIKINLDVSTKPEEITNISSNITLNIEPEMKEKHKESNLDLNKKKEDLIAIKAETNVNKPLKESDNIQIKSSLNDSDKNKSKTIVQGNLLTLSQIIDSNYDLSGTPFGNIKKKETLSTSIKGKTSKPNVKNTELRKSKVNLSKSNIVPSEGKKITEKVNKSGKKGETEKLSKRVSKVENNINIGGNTAKNKFKQRPSLTQIKPKEVKLPAKLIKMKDIISQKYQDPIHDVKEIPRCDIYHPKK